ncbi:uncharacterized protein TM35_000141080 [Trypanosoma theileri]|uniref:Uncharacterized protein n=1 Tax=Trypanosoma theileri TaxID=67003 RepID=A0A1X0NW34_9TRYP|nr:uncharacterized protein TM35_000141080 [Trypanosoma theileri]ORC88897.1 hypothetical protein TM35_000141080 [Trypanosoma theileri]
MIGSIVVCANECRVKSNDSDTFMSLEYLAHYGNVTAHLDEKEFTVGVSFCQPDEYSSDGLKCGPGYMIIYYEGCGATFTSSGELSEENGTILFNLTSQSNFVANMQVECDKMVNGLQVLEANLTSSKTYFFRFASMTVCPGYKTKGGDDFLSKGAIIVIVSGIVGVVIATALIFQWKSRSRSGEDYTQLI